MDTYIAKLIFFKTETLTHLFWSNNDFVFQNLYKNEADLRSDKTSIKVFFLADIFCNLRNLHEIHNLTWVFELSVMEKSHSKMTSLSGFGDICQTFGRGVKKSLNGSLLNDISCI